MQLFLTNILSSHSRPTRPKNIATDPLLLFDNAVVDGTHIEILFNLIRGAMNPVQQKPNCGMISDKQFFAA